MANDIQIKTEVTDLILESLENNSNMTNNGMFSTGQENGLNNDNQVSDNTGTNLKINGIKTVRRKHTCEICGHRFSRKQSLDNHRYKRVCQASYKCSLCGKYFQLRRVFEKHRNHCPRRFSLLQRPQQQGPANRLLHQVRHHPPPPINARGHPQQQISMEGQNHSPKTIPTGRQDQPPPGVSTERQEQPPKGILETILDVVNATAQRQERLEKAIVDLNTSFIGLQSQISEIQKSISKISKISGETGTDEEITTVKDSGKVSTANESAKWNSAATTPAWPGQNIAPANLVVLRQKAGNVSDYTKTLLRLIYSPEALAGSSVSGKGCNAIKTAEIKPKLPQVEAVMNYIAAETNTNLKRVRQIVTWRLNSESKKSLAAKRRSAPPEAGECQLLRYSAAEQTWLPVGGAPEHDDTDSDSRELTNGNNNSFSMHTMR